MRFSRLAPYFITGIAIIFLCIIGIIGIKYASSSPPNYTNEIRKVQNDSTNMSLKTIYYFKDTDTNICFAAWGNYWSNGMRITSVLCSPEVEAKIGK